MHAPQVTALAAGRLDDGAAIDTLLVGSQTNLLAYDVESNSEVYFKVKRRPIKIKTYVHQSRYTAVTNQIYFKVIGDQSNVLQGKQ